MQSCCTSQAQTHTSTCISQVVYNTCLSNLNPTSLCNVFFSFTNFSLSQDFFYWTFFPLKIFKFFFLSFQHFEFAMFISFSSFSKLCTTNIHIFKCTSTLFVLSSFFLALSSFKLSSSLFKLFLSKTNFSWEVNMGRHMMKLGEPLEFVHIQV